MTYPDGPPLGTDVAELLAFVGLLKLLDKLRKEGHTQPCVRGQVFRTEGCRCKS